jgi:hypothetical protein
VARFAGLLASLWLVFYFSWRALPYVQPGSVIVYAAKENLERRGELFPAPVPASSRLIVFGNSKVLTGFIPATFDSLLCTPIYSYNMGKPDESHFVKDIETLARLGQTPHKVLLTLPWSVAPGSPPRDDSEIMARLFPFRKFPRDLVLFSVLAPRHGGLTASYRYGEQAVRTMEGDRGWYFIEGQSHSPKNSLPDELRVGGDRPWAIDEPAFAAHGVEFNRLSDLAEKFDFSIYIVPSYHRVGELAPSPETASGVAARMQGFPRFKVVGPNYFLFSNRYFSDPVHLNPEGAQLYTRRLAEIMEPVLRQETHSGP